MNRKTRGHTPSRDKKTISMSPSEPPPPHHTTSRPITRLSPPTRQIPRPRNRLPHCFPSPQVIIISTRSLPLQYPLHKRQHIRIPIQIAMPPLRNRHSQLLPLPQPLIHRLRRRKRHRRRPLRVRKRIRSTLLQHHRARRDRRNDGMRVVRKLRGVVDELGQCGGGPPRSAGFLVTMQRQHSQGVKEGGS